MINFVLVVVFLMNGEVLTYKVDTIQECIDMRGELEGRANVYCKPNRSQDGISVKELLNIIDTKQKRKNF